VVCEKEKGSSSIQLHSVALNRRAKFVWAAINGHAVHFKVDSGAEVTVVPSTFPSVTRQLQKVDGELTCPGNTSLQVLGAFEVALHWKGKSSIEQAYVIRVQDPPLLGSLAIQALGVIKFVNSVSSPQALQGKDH
ncbi:MAG: hypothetical protein PV344_04040, partial [Anaplasma sp.]|nr:hypothetical protein [Anaplasma sp.]